MDVFTSTPKQTLQMSSFYASQENARGQQRPHPNPHLKAHLHLYPPPTTSYPIASNAHMDTTILPSSTGTALHSTASQPPPPPTVSKQPAIPALRKIMKSAIIPTYVSGVFMCFAGLNTVIALVSYEDSMSLLRSEWEIFIRLWVFVTTIQLVAHSVYICTSLQTCIALLHFVVVFFVGVLPVQYVSVSLLWLIPIYRTITFAYQSALFYMIYPHVKRKWVYILAGVFFALSPMTTLLRTDVIDNESAGALFVYSTVSKYTLYIFAFINSYNANIVDVTIAPSPTWVPE